MSDVDLVGKPSGISTVLRSKIHPPSDKDGVRSDRTDMVSEGYDMDVDGEDHCRNQLDPSAIILEEEQTYKFAQRNIDQNRISVTDVSDYKRHETVASPSHDEISDKKTEYNKYITADQEVYANKNSDAPEKKSEKISNDDSHYGILRLKI